MVVIRKLYAFICRAVAAPTIQSIAHIIKNAPDLTQRAIKEDNMADIDLNALSLAELKQLEKNVAKAITSFEDRRKTEARAKVDELARELGFRFDELAEAAPTRKRAASAPKYRHP